MRVNILGGTPFDNGVFDAKLEPMRMTAERSVDIRVFLGNNRVEV